MPFWTCILECSDGSYDVGHTDDLPTRLGQHDVGSLGGYTAMRLPVVLRWAGELPTRDEAFAVERRLKGWSRAKKEAVIRGEWTRYRTSREAAGVLRQARHERAWVVIGAG